MKKLVSLLLAFTFAIALSACGESTDILPNQSMLNSESNGNGENIPTTDKNSDYEFFSEHDLSAFELLGYYLDENGEVWIDSVDWEECSYELFREYMFGSWLGLDNGEIIIDEPEKGIGYGPYWNEKYLRRDDTIIYFYSSDFSDGIHWLDINEPDKLYSDEVANTNQKESGNFSPFKRKLNISNEYKEVRFFTRNNELIN